MQLKGNAHIHQARKLQNLPPLRGVAFAACHRIRVGPQPGLHRGLRGGLGDASLGDGRMTVTMTE